LSFNLEIHSAAIATHWGSWLVLWLIGNYRFCGDEERSD
jgi:hypothetical protein